MNLYISEAEGTYRAATVDEIIEAARAALACRLCRGEKLDSPATTAAYLMTQLSDRAQESFGVLWLDTRHRILAFDELFRGTLDGLTVYPREIVKAALGHNAAACILAHNHPSGDCEPSAADYKMTARIKAALGMIDVRVLDHMVVGGGRHSSMAARGML